MIDANDARAMSAVKIDSGLADVFEAITASARIGATAVTVRELTDAECRRLVYLGYVIHFSTSYSTSYTDACAEIIWYR